MATSTLETPLGPSSGIVDSQLVATADRNAIMPPAASYVVPSVGAAVSTLPGGIGGASGNAGAPQDAVGSQASAEQAGGASSGGKILGLPSVVFWVLVAVLVGYVFIWQVHFR